MIFYERPVSAGLLCQRSDMEKTLESQYIYKGKIINVRKDKVLLPDGKTTSREVVEHRGGVCVVPVDENGNVTLVRQYRYPIGREVLEIPAGKREEGEDPFETARRELSEETGLEAGRYDFLGEFLATPGYCAEKFYIYLARDLTRHAQHLDEGVTRVDQPDCRLQIGGGAAARREKNRRNERKRRLTGVFFWRPSAAPFTL